MRIDPEQKRHPVYLLQPVYNVVLAMLFEWGVAVHDLNFEAIRKGEKDKKQLRKEFKGIAGKARTQIQKDYIAWPLISGLYVRQLTGAANIDGGPVLNVISGNLGYQVEHHLFPDMPSTRYGEIAPKVREICRRYGLPYNSGPFHQQLGMVQRTIVRLAFPGGRHRRPSHRSAGRPCPAGVVAVRAVSRPPGRDAGRNRPQGCREAAHSSAWPNRRARVCPPDCLRPPVQALS